MTVLIDTHTLIWMLYDSASLSDDARRAVNTNRRCISIASLWEISIKKALGKIDIELSATELAQLCEKKSIAILPIKPEYCTLVETLHRYHDDPFDRIIMATSLVEGFPLVTRDKLIKRGYPEVTSIW